ncbi:MULTISPECIES: OmpA/MotB family protein [Curtobacterium]|uniref:OmpA/MotB family protein n=1 Tax=Curtobacterium TaxID=2034 RepID=UPI001563A992|nr:flagellar motor protein MotB [Curtobacterium flaccumfaciens]NQX23857.1 flagellar motor protein MotB [Curtobacterium sp. VKM Ac-2852]MBT1582789.1 flagellar motor protein MotB [Curtobacterium flaccumfaciens pv. flaccumfaciens]MCS5493788.1 flagellar motor protein MotB [Curtobacterium flaccumfaciens pv. flaccumfaciens]MCS5514176.1 flagellar motor protein MotB [Curtobacterium flaccumfaciens pv. betae]MCX2797033.1 flagellar motor protein MotB [Curtobacterium flaccumfaciens pv. flaccumfaciens]
MSANPRGRGRGRAKKSHDEAEHPDERWMASYMDMITVLMCMFLVLFAMSTVDQEKYIQLKQSLATGFGEVDSQKIDTASGTVVTKDQVEDGSGYSTDKSQADHSTASSGTKDTNVDPASTVVPTTATKQDLAEAKRELDDLTKLERAIQHNLAKAGQTENVQFTVDARGLIVRLIGSETYFGTNSADLSDQARSIMDAIAPVLKTSDHDVSVEGHADQRNSTAPYATNWELSAARATGVLRDLVERGGMPGEHVQSVGFGSSRPLAKGGTDRDLALNRRVDIVVLSNADQDVSALMPALAKAQDGAQQG